MSINRSKVGGLALALAMAGVTSRLPAQGTFTASARGFGMGGAYGAVARGVSAGPLNPALLGLADNPGFTLALPSVSVDAGSSPIGWRDVRPYAGKLVPEEIKQSWLARIPVNGNFRMAAGLAAQPFGISIGPVALHVTGIAGGSAELPRDAVSLLLFGNADSNDQGGTYDLDRGTAIGFAATSAGLSIGQHLAHLGGGQLALGVTAKVVFGIGFVGLQGSTGSVSGTPLGGDVRFPTVTIDNTSRPLDHRGYGLDAGVAWQTRRLTLGVAVSDLFNTFRWNADDARLRDGRVLFNADSASGSFTDRPLDDPALDPTTVGRARKLISRARFRPAIRASAALSMGRFLFSAEGYHVTGGLTGRKLGAWTHGAIGAEWRWLGGFLPLRGGAGLAGDRAFDWSAGTGLDFSAFNLNVAYGETRPSGGGTQSRVALGVGIGRGR